MKITDLKKYICKPTQPLVDAMIQINENSQGILYVVDENNCIIGSLTDGDIRRSLIQDGILDKLVCNAMNTKPITLQDNIIETDIDWKLYPRITILPIVNKNEQLLYLISRDSKKNIYFDNSLSNIKTVIMAGGKGTRLYPYTKILPKPLIPIGEVPILERIINEYTKFGITDFYLTLNYKAGIIKSYFEEIHPSYDLTFVHENIPLGTAGSLKLLNISNDENIFVANCDTLIKANYSDIYMHHINSESALTIVSALKQIKVPYGVLNVSDNGIICSMEEKPSLNYLINTGMYILNSKYIDLIPNHECYHMPQLAEKLISLGKKVTMYPISEECFLDMGEFSEMKRMEEKIETKAFE